MEFDGNEKENQVRLLTLSQLTEFYALLRNDTTIFYDELVAELLGRKVEFKVPFVELVKFCI